MTVAVRPETSRLLSWAVVVAAALALFSLVAVSPHHPIYDEAWYLDTLQLLSRDGLSVAFLRDFPGAAGPTFTFVFHVADAVFGLAFPWLRFVNVALLAATAVLIGRCLAGTPNAKLSAAMLTVLPTTGVAAGMALTEMPAAFFAVAAIALLVQAFATRHTPAIAFAAIGGVALAAAILGRQNYLLLLPCLALAVRWSDGRPNQPDLVRVAMLAAVTLLIVTPVFVLWGGLVPSRTAWSTTGLAPGNVVRGAGYAGLIVLLLAPEICAPLLRRRAFIALIAFISIPVAMLFVDAFVPMRSTIRALFGHGGMVIVATVASYLVSLAALSFLSCFALHLWRYRDAWLIRFAGTAVVLGLASNAKITHQFSSRYVFIVLPLIVIAVAPAMRIAWHTPIRMTIAASISLAAIASYYFAP
ncbi:MAG: hypothetical protein WC670_11845 [Pseudolabrys sp.]